MATELISLNCVLDHLTPQDDLEAWKAILDVISEEFEGRYGTEGSRKEAWFLRIGTCSHWVRPHQSRWTAAGGFALPIGYKGASWLLSEGLPEFDWSVIVLFDGQRWTRVDKFSGKKQIVLRVAVPTRTLRHKQAAVHSMWSTSHQLTFYGFRNVDGKWLCVAASDENKQGRMIHMR